MNPEEDILNELDAQTFSGQLLTAGTNLFRGMSREPDGTLITAPCVWVRDPGAGNITPYMGGPSGPDYTRSIVFVEVWGQRNQYATTEAIAEAIFRFLHKREVSGYTKVVATQNRPGPVEDNEGRPLFSMTFSAEYKEAR